MKTSRQRVLEFIQSHRGVSAAEISRALQMTEANARHHLDILEVQGLVEVVGQAPAQGKGRPRRLFGLAEHALGHNLDGLADVLLGGLAAALPPQDFEPFLKKAAQSLKGEQGKPGRKISASLTQRLFNAVQRLNELNYLARWEAHAEAPRLILGRCPYAAILPEHPELCRFDGYLLESLAEAPVTQTARLARDARGLPHCVFALKK
jgi:predicted ArsR family transcriptional regulator